MHASTPEYKGLRYELERWIFHSFQASPHSLASCRILTALYLLLVISPGHSAQLDFSFLASVPDVFYSPPPGPMQLFDDFPSATYFECIHFLLNVCGVALLVGYRTRVVSIAISLLLLAGFGFSYSLGKVNHNILFVLLPLVMSASNWGKAYSYDALSERNVSGSPVFWPITLMAFLLGFAMFSAGVPKLLSGWLETSSHAVHRTLVGQYFVNERQDFLAPYLLSFDCPTFWEGLDWATVLFETGFLVAVFHPSSTRLFAGFAVLFHFGVLLVLNISFLNHLVVYALFVDWDTITERFRWPDYESSMLGKVARLIPPEILVSGLSIPLYLFGSPLLHLDGLLDGTSSVGVIDLLLLGGAASLVVFIWLRGSLRYARKLAVQM